MKKAISMFAVFLAGSLFGETNILLQNAKMHVELSPSIFYLPVVIRSDDGENILPPHDTFRTIYAYKNERKNILWADEDNRNEKVYQLVSSAAAGEKPMAWQTKLKTDFFDITRLLAFQENASAIIFTYTCLCTKDITLSSAEGQYFPYLPLSPEYDRLVFALDLNDTVDIIELPNKNKCLSLKSPFILPFFARSSKNGHGVCLMPLSAKGFDHFVDSQNITLRKGDVLETSFSITCFSALANDTVKEISLPFFKKLDVKKEFLAYYYNMMGWLIKPSDVDKALALGLKSIAAKPDYSKAYNLAAYCYQDKKDLLNQMNYWLKASELDPDNTSYMEWSANSIRGCVKQGLLPKEKINDALKLHEKTVALNPNDPFHHSSIADTYIYLGDYRNALKHYERSLELLRGPETGQAYKKKYIPLYEKTINELNLKLKENK